MKTAKAVQVVAEQKIELTTLELKNIAYAASIIMEDDVKNMCDKAEKL